MAIAEIALGDVRDLRVDLTVMPMATVLSLAGDVAGTSQGVPPPWRQVVRSGLPSHGLETLTPLFGSGPPNIPHCLGPSVSVRDTDFDAHLDQIIETAGAHLTEQVEELHGAAPPAAWRSVLRRPAKWLDGYAATLRSTWRSFQPVWRRATTLIDRETTRIGVASVRGGFDMVLADLNPRWRYRDQTLSIPIRQAEWFDLAGRRLVLTPTVSGAGASIFDPDLPDQIWLGYPVPGLDSLWRPGRPIEQRDALELLVGPVRARLLRAAHVPVPMRTLAEAAGCAPNVATYHCAQLVDAGLLTRRQRGRHVYVGRTDRGHAVVDLLS